MTNPVYRFSELLIMLYEEPIYILIAFAVLFVCLFPVCFFYEVSKLMSKNKSSSEEKNEKFLGDHHG